MQEGFLTPGTYYPDTGGFSVRSPFERLLSSGYLGAQVMGFAGFFGNLISDNRDAAIASLGLAAAGFIGDFAAERVRCSRESSGVVQKTILND